MSADWALKRAIEIVANYKVTPVIDTTPVEDRIANALREERDRCRRAANLYEKGPEAQARVAGSIRKQIEDGK